MHMHLISCSVLLSRSADPVMSLDFANIAAAAPATRVSIFQQHVGQPRKAKDLPVPTLPVADAHNFALFTGRLLAVCDRIRALVAKETGAGQFYGKASVTGGRMRFHFGIGDPVPNSPTELPDGPLWQEAWTRTPRAELPLGVDVLSAMDLLGGDEELLLSNQFVSALTKSNQSAVNGVYGADSGGGIGSSDPALSGRHRACFACRTAANDQQLRLLVWLHPDGDDGSTAADLDDIDTDKSWLKRRLECATVNNYLCAFERLPATAVASAAATWTSLMFLAVESDSFAVADWLLSSGRCRVDATDGWGDTALARCCRAGGHPPAALRFLLARGADRHRRDADGSSALHRLLAALLPTADADVQPALDALLAGLTPQQLADWLAEPNAAGERPAALACNPTAVDHLLKRLLKPTASGTELGVQQQAVTPEAAAELLRSPNGYSLVHSFAAFDRLEAAEAVVTSHLGGAAWQRLLGDDHWATVESGSLLGYSAMHAAFQEGNWPNVRRLLAAADCPPPPPSAVDLAIRERHLARYDQFVDFAGAAATASAAGLRMIDCAEDCLSKAQALDRPADDSAALRFRLHGASARVSLWDAVSASAAAASAAADDDDSWRGERRRLLESLRVAFEHDAITDGTVAAVTRCQRGGWLSLLEDPELQRRMAVALRDHLLDDVEDDPYATGVSGEAESGHGGSEAGDSSLLGLALRLGKWRLAGELLPTRQFDLLPACLGVMLQLRLRPDTESVGRRRTGLRRSTELLDAPAAAAVGELPMELLEDLYRLAKRTFCGALNRLYRGAVTERQKGLVFDYLGGRFHHDKGRGSISNSRGLRGPLFSNTGDARCGNDDGDGHCVFDLMLLTNEPELLSLPCATDYVDRLMASPRSSCCHHCAARAPGPPCLALMSHWWPEEASRLRRCLPTGFTPRASMLLCFLFNMAFVCLLGYYLHEVGEPRSSGARLVLKLVLLLCGLSYAAQEVQDICSSPVAIAASASAPPGSRLLRRLSRYAAYRWNLVDVAAVVLLLAGLVWVFVLDAQHAWAGDPASSSSLPYYFARLILAIAFVLYCLRMLASLGYYERLGLYISITKTTILMDVVPFLIVNAFFLASFGVLIVCLLFPGGHVYPAGQAYAAARPVPDRLLSTGAYIAEVFERPLLAHFGEYGAEGLRTCQQQPAGGDDDVTDCPHPLGNKIYIRCVLFVYLLIVSVVLANVLIAKLSLTVSREDGRARVIWRSFRAQLLLEFSGSSPAPPLVLALRWAALLPVRLARRLCGSHGRPDAAAGAATASAATTTAASASGLLTSCVEMATFDGDGQAHTSRGTPWWMLDSSGNRAPEDYNEFLWFQAMQFRNRRHTFSHYEI